MRSTSPKNRRGNRPGSRDGETETGNTKIDLSNTSKRGEA